MMELKLPAKLPIWLLIAGAAGALLLVLAPFGTGRTDAAPTKQQEQKTVEEYRTQLEGELTGLLSSIEGVSEINLMITLESAGEKVYATEKRASVNLLSDSLSASQKRVENQNDSEDSYIILKSADGSESAILVKQLQPVVKGAAIVCKGADNEVIRQKLIETTAIALDLPTNRVSVVAK
jgi:stage III sporulation protein AG